MEPSIIKSNFSSRSCNLLSWEYISDAPYIVWVKRISPTPGHYPVVFHSRNSFCYTDMTAAVGHKSSIPDALQDILSFFS